VGISDQIHCQEWCDTYPGCNLASYEHYRGICTLWLAPSRPTPPCSGGNGVLSYWKLAPAVSATIPGFELLGNGACSGTVFLRSSNGAQGAGNVGISDQIHCQEWCDTYPGCNLASYEHYRGICTLWLAPSRPTPPCSGGNGVLSYWKLAPAVPATIPGFELLGNGACGEKESPGTVVLRSSNGALGAGNVGIKDQIHCQKWCGTHPSCTLAAYEHYRGICTLRQAPSRPSLPCSGGNGILSYWKLMSTTSTTTLIPATSTTTFIPVTSVTTVASSTTTSVRQQRKRSHSQCPPYFGHNASLTQAGYASVACRCCTPEMEKFLRRVVANQGFVTCSEGGLQGFLLWFDCADHGKTYDDLLRELAQSANGQCAWLSKSQTLCRDMTGCGVFPDVHRRRRCGSGQAESFVSWNMATPNEDGDSGDG